VQIQLDGKLDEPCCQTARVAGVVFVISDFLDAGGVLEGIRRLAGRKFGLYALHLVAPQERDVELSGDVELCDVETGRTLRQPLRRKTLIGKTLAAALGMRHARIQFTPDLMPADIVGTNIVVEDAGGNKQMVFQKGPVFTNLLLADEINRAPPKPQSALLKAMQEHHVTVGGKTYDLGTSKAVGESAGQNRQGVADERAVRERASDPSRP
jgi:hypothetical protein